MLDVDFNLLPIGAYEESDLRSDFRVSSLLDENGDVKYTDGVYGPEYSTFITNDPANSGRGQVLEVVRFKDKFGSGPEAGGMRFRADLPPAEEYYFSYDTYVPSDWVFPKQHKQPALIYGSLLQASHPPGVLPNPDGLNGFNSRTQIYNGVDMRGEGAIATKPLHSTYNPLPDTRNYEKEYWWDKENPSADNPDKLDPYIHPKGHWITIEQRVKMNTADTNKNYSSTNDLVDGVIETWITDSAAGFFGKKVFSRSFLFRFRDRGVIHDNMLVDGIYMYDHTGGSEGEGNVVNHDQSRYYDNFIVSDSPITH